MSKLDTSVAYVKVVSRVTTLLAVLSVILTIAIYVITELSTFESAISFFVCLFAAIVLFSLKSITSRYCVKDQYLTEVEECIRLLKEKDSFKKVNVIMYELLVGTRKESTGCFIFNESEYYNIPKINDKKAKPTYRKFSDFVVKKTKIKRKFYKVKYIFSFNKATYFDIIVYKKRNGLIINSQFENNEDAYDNFIGVIERLKSN